MFYRKPRVVAAIITISMLLSLITSFCLPVTADTGAIEITNASQWANIANNLNGDYILTADIDFGNVNNYSPIGSKDAPFTGTLNGNGHTIENLTLQTTDNYVGLFGVNNGTIRKLHIADTCSFSGNAYVGAVAGVNNGTIEDCVSEATVTYNAVASANTEYKILTQNLCQWGDTALATAKWQSFSYTEKLATIQKKYTFYDSRRPGMLSRIEEANPDIICFQEVSFTDITIGEFLGTVYGAVQAWNTYLHSNLPSLIEGRDYGLYGNARNTKIEPIENPQEGVIIAYDTEVFKIATDDNGKDIKGEFWLTSDPTNESKHPDANNFRMCTWMMLEDKATGQQVAVYNIHLDFNNANTEGAKVVKQYLTDLKAQYPDAIFIAAGDYNASKGARGHAVMNEVLEDTRYLADAEDFAENQSVNTHTSIGKNSGETDINDDTSFVPTGTIDHILLSGDLVDVKNFEVLNDMYDSNGVMVYDPEGVKETAAGGTPMNPSDHNGVATTITPITEKYIGGLAGKNTGVTSLASEEYVEAYATSISDFSANPSAVTYGDFKIDTIDDWMWVFENHATYFTDSKVNVHLMCNIDLSNDKASTFTGFQNAKFSFDGHGNTISNWGTAESQKSTYGLFYLNNNGGMNFLRNFNVTNCHVKGADSLAALVYGCVASGSTHFNCPENLTMENIHVSDCSLDNASRAVLLGQYHCGNTATVNMNNCSVIGTELKGSYNNTGVLIGRMDSGETFNVTNCYIADSHVRRAMDNSGLLVGDRESAVFNAKNIVIVNSSMNATGTGNSYASLFGTYLGGSGTLTNIAAYNNTLTSNMATYAISTGSVTSAPKLTVSNIYINNEELTRAYTADGITSFCQLDFSTTATYKTDSVFESGEMAYTLNNAQSGSEDALYWSMDDTLIVPGTLENQTRKYTLKQNGGSVIESGYANGGSDVNLNYESDEIILYSLAEGSSGELNENTLTMPENGTDATVIATPVSEDPNHVYITVNGERYYTTTGDAVTITEDAVSFTGETVDISGIAGPVSYFVNNKEVEPNTTITANEDLTISVAVSVSDATESSGTKDYTISNLTEWLYVYNNHKTEFFDTEITMHLMCDINLKNVEFNGFENPKFSFNGNNHIIYNWGTESDPIVAPGLFYVNQNQDGGMNFLKNFRLDNCHTTGTSGQWYTALVYAPGCANAGSDYLPTDFTMENVRVVDSSHISRGEVGGILMAKYGSTKGENHVTIKNCYVVSSTLDATNTNHQGVVIGKIVNYEAKINCEISDIFIRDVEVLNGNTGCGLVIGTAEGGKATANLTNIGVFNSVITTANDAAIIGYSDDGATTLKNGMFAGNTLNAGTDYGTYIMATTNTNKLSSATNVYCDDNTFSSTAEGTALTHTTVTNADVISGKIPYELNQQLASPSFYWRKGSDCAMPATEKQQVRKIEVVSASGAVTYAADDANTYYVNGGEKLDLSQYATDTAMMVTSGNGTIINNVLTASTDGDTAVTVYGEDDVAYPVVEALAFFEGKDMNDFADSAAVSTAVANAKAKLIADEYTTKDAAQADAALLNNYAATYNGAAVTELTVSIAVPEKVYPGDTFTVPLTLSGTGLAGMNVVISYNPDQLSLTSIANVPTNERIFAYMYGNGSLTNGDYADDGSVFLSFANFENTTTDGTLANLTFTVADSFTGDATISAETVNSSETENDAAFDINGKYVEVSGSQSIVKAITPPTLVVNAPAGKKPGESFTVPVEITNNTAAGLMMMNLGIGYDTSALSLTGIEKTDLFDYMMGGEAGFDDDGYITLSFIAVEELSGIEDGAVVNLTFTIKSDVAVSETIITAETVNTSEFELDAALDQNLNYVKVLPGSAVCDIILPVSLAIETPETVQPGEEFTVPVKITDNTGNGLMMINLGITYDSSTLSLTGIEQTALFNYMMGGEAGFDDDGYIVLSFIATDEGKLAGVEDGTFVNLTFTVKKGISVEDTTITVGTVNTSEFERDGALDQYGNYISILPCSANISLDYSTPTISVTITWGALEFLYTNPTWNPAKLEYEGGGWAPAEENGNLITVENTGTADVNLELGYASYTNYSTLSGKFKDGTNDVTEPIKLVAGSEAVNYWFNLDGVTEERWTDEFIPVGSITIAIS